jgi:signal transduction histidine kinase
MTPAEQETSRPEAAFERLRRRALVVLGAGFTAVFVLLIIVGYVGLQNNALLSESAANLAELQLSTTEALDRIQRSQVALRMVVFNLVNDPDSVDAAQLQEVLTLSERGVEQALAAVQGTPTEARWEPFRRAFRSFVQDARRVLQSGDPGPTATGDLFRRQEEVMFTLRQLVNASHQASLRAQASIDLRALQLRRRSQTLLAASLAAAMLAAFASVRTSLHLVERIERQTRQLDQVSMQLIEKQEETARRFSHELHDELGQSLTAVKANLAALKRGAPDLDERKADCLHLIDEAIHNVREMSQLLHPAILDHFGLAGGLRWLAEGYGQRTGIEVEVETDFEGRLQPDARAHLFRIAQEALTNISRHSGATRVEITLQQIDDQIALRISDNGKGLRLETPEGSKGLGLVGMRARARLAGGDLTLQSKPGKGLRIDVRAPIGGRDDGTEDAHPAG